MLYKHETQPPPPPLHRHHNHHRTFINKVICIIYLCTFVWFLRVDAERSHIIIRVWIICICIMHREWQIVPNTRQFHSDEYIYIYRYCGCFKRKILSFERPCKCYLINVNVYWSGSPVDLWHNYFYIQFKIRFANLLRMYLWQLQDQRGYIWNLITSTSIYLCNVCGFFRNA